MKGHIGSCGQCRKSVLELERLIHELKGSLFIDQTSSDAEHLEERQIARYVKGDLNEVERQAVKSHLRQCGGCMKSVLHYRLRLAVGEESERDRQEVAQRRVCAVAIKKQRQFCVSMKNMWVVSSALAAGLFIVTFNPLGGMLANNDTVLLAVGYDEVAYLTMSGDDETIPGIGFFSKATQEETRIPYRGLEVSVNDERHIGLAWAPIPQVERYTIKLILIREGERSIVVEKELGDTEYTVGHHEAVANQRYEWELVGHSAHASFHTRGGFVIDQLPRP